MLSLSILAAAVACGGNTPTNPGGTAPPASTTPTLIMIHSGQAWFRPGDQEAVTTNARWSDNASRELENPTWLSTNTAVFTIAPANTRAVITAMAPGEAMLRVTALGVSGEIPVRVAATTQPPSGGGSPSNPQVVISEFRFAGPGGENDDFIELHNRSSQAVDLSGWSIAVSDGSGAAEPTGNVPSGTTLAPGCHYLFVSARPKQASGESPVAADFLFWPPAAADGGLALLDADGRIVDQVGASAGSRYREGTPLSASTFGGGSYTRAQDSNDNSDDFLLAAVATQANRESACSTSSSR